VEGRRSPPQWTGGLVLIGLGLGIGAGAVGVLAFRRRDIDRD
jgi:hypothetical protein